MRKNELLLKRLRNCCIFLGMMAVATGSYASSHREAPLIANDPQADNTDVYAFRSPNDPNSVTIIADYIPFEAPDGGPNYYRFGQNVRYEIHIKNRTTTTVDDITYRFTFAYVNQDPTTFFNIRLGAQNQKTTYTCQKSMDGGVTWTTIVSNGVVPPNNIGPRSIESAVGLNTPAPGYSLLMQNAIQTATTGERVFCGPADDPFFVDLGGAFDLANIRDPYINNMNPSKDGLARFNVHSIAIQVPINLLQKDGLDVSQATNILDPNFVIGVWASASRRQIKTIDTANGPSYSGNWIQVSRLGMPLTNEVIIPIGMKDKWNASNPAGDSIYAAYYCNPELALYMDDSQYGSAVPALAPLRIQKNSLGHYDFRNNQAGLFSLKGTAAVAGTALDDAAFGNLLLPNNHSPRAVDLLPIFLTGVPNLAPYQLAVGKNGNPLAAGKPIINNFLPTKGDMLRLNMAVPSTVTSPFNSSLGLIEAVVRAFVDPTFNGNTNIQLIPNMDGFPNGRRLGDDVTTIELQAVSGVVLASIGLFYDDYNGTGSPLTQNFANVLNFEAGITHNDTSYQANFPYVQVPWRGFDYTIQDRF